MRLIHHLKFWPSLKVLRAGLVLSVVPWLMGASGCPNAFSELSNKESDAALLYQAESLIDTRNYTEAIEIIQSMTAVGQAARATRVVLASAYAGRCGLELIDFAEALENMGTTQLLTLLLSSFSAGTADSVTDCKAAETELLTISNTAADRTDDENILLAFVELAKMGVILAASKADADDDDGTVDADFDSCSTATTLPTDNGISDSDVQHLGTGLTITLASLSAAGSGVAGDVTTEFATVCTAIDTFLSTTGFCDQTSPSDFDATEILGLRALIKSNEIGFNTCGGAVGSGLACICM